MNRTASSLMGLHAQTALHPGAGTALGVVDLPIQRERHTGWPTIPGSALKGILRDRCRSEVANSNEERELMQTLADVTDDGLEDLRKGKSDRPLAWADATQTITALFGPPSNWASEFAGALSVTDARLLAFPVRSMRGVFAWVTCRSALERLHADARMGGAAPNWDPVDVPEGHFAVAETCQCVHEGKYVVLEEFDFEKHDDADTEIIQKLGTWLADHIMTGVSDQRVLRQLVILNDDDFTHFARHATEVAARIKLNYETKTVEKGQLFWQEFLPAETIMYSVVIANPSRAHRSQQNPAELLNSLRDLIVVRDDLPTVLQVGADETTGKGLCAVTFNSDKFRLSHNEVTA